MHLGILIGLVVVFLLLCICTQPRQQIEGFNFLTSIMESDISQKWETPPPVKVNSQLNVNKQGKSGNESITSNNKNGLTSNCATYYLAKQMQIPESKLAENIPYGNQPPLPPTEFQYLKNVCEPILYNALVKKYPPTHSCRLQTIQPEDHTATIPFDTTEYQAKYFGISSAGDYASILENDVKRGGILNRIQGLTRHMGQTKCRELCEGDENCVTHMTAPTMSIDPSDNKNHLQFNCYLCSEKPSVNVLGLSNITDVDQIYDISKTCLSTTEGDKEKCKQIRTDSEQVMCPNPSKNPNDIQAQLCNATKINFTADVSSIFSYNPTSSTIILKGEVGDKPTNYQQFEFTPYLETRPSPIIPDPTAIPTGNPKPTNTYTHLLAN